MAMYEPPGTVILRGEVGSTLHGTAVGGQDDRDEMAVVVADRQYVTGLKRWESHVWRSKPDGVRSEAGDLDLTYYELRRFVELAMRGNPSILLLLYVPLGKLVSSTPRGIGLQQLALEIVSMQTVPRYRGYMKSQALRLLGQRGVGRGARTGARPELVDRYGYDTKFAMHMVRLGFQGVELCEEGHLSLPMSGDALLACRRVREGQVTVDEALELAFQLDEKLAKFENGDRGSALRDRPNDRAVDEWLHAAYLEVWTD